MVRTRARRQGVQVDGDHLRQGEVASRSPRHARAVVALLALTTIWGSTFVVLKSGLDDVSPFLLIATRFALASLALGVVHRASLRAAPGLFRPALPLSLSLFGGFALQTLGLQGTTPARSAFLTALSVLLVPPFEYLVSRRLPAARLLLAVLLAALGVWALFRPLGSEWRPGDTLTALGAVCFGYYFVELGRVSRIHPTTALVLVQFVTLAGLAALAALGLERSFLIPTPPLLAGFGYLAVVCTVGTFLLMTWAQARVEATEAGVIYTLEPVIAALFSVALGHERLDARLVQGGALILVATLVAALAPAAPSAAETRRPAPRTVRRTGTQEMR